MVVSPGSAKAKRLESARSRVKVERIKKGFPKEKTFLLELKIFFSTKYEANSLFLRRYNIRIPYILSELIRQI